MSNEPSHCPLELILLVEPDQVSNYAIERAVELAQVLGVELRARLIQDRNAERAARLPLTRLIRLETGRRDEFTLGDIEKQLRRAAEKLERHLEREARRRGVTCRLDVATEVQTCSGTRWVLISHPGSLRERNLPATRQEVVFILNPPRTKAPSPVTAMVFLISPNCEDLAWAAQVAAQCGLTDPPVVFTNQPIRCEREVASNVPFQGFQPLPRTPLSARCLLHWIGRHGATSALIVLPKDPGGTLENWAVQLAQFSEIPLVFLRKTE